MGLQLAMLPDALPASWYDVLLLPVFFVGVSVFVYAAGRAAELKLKDAAWKWWSLLPLAAALYSGYGPLSYMSDVAYRSGAEDYGRKMVAAHYLAFWLPMAGVVGIAIWWWLDRKFNRVP